MDSPPRARGSSTLSGVALVAALGVLLAFGAFAWIMIGELDSDEVRWTRLAWLFSSVEAIAFGAAGALFGSSIQRERAEKAEHRAEAAEEVATRGRALAEMIKAAPGDGSGGLETLGTPADRGASLATLQSAARRMFPDL